MAALKGATLACARTSIPFDSYSILLLSFYRREPGCCLSMPVVIGRKGITELCPFSWTVTRRRSYPSVHEKSRHRQTISSSGFSNLVESAPNAVKVQRSSTMRSRQTRVHRHRRQRQRPSGQGESRTYKEPLLPQPACYRGSQLSAPSKFQCSHIMSFASIPVSMAVRRYNDQGLACGWDHARSAGRRVPALWRTPELDRPLADKIPHLRIGYLQNQPGNYLELESGRDQHCFLHCGYDSPLNAEHLEHVNIINSSTASLLNLIKDILDLSKVEAGMIKLSMEWMHLPSLLGGSH